MDVGFSLAVMALFGWALVIIWAVVRFTSAGPAIFAQIRIGRYEKPFTCYKFRTMRVGTPDAATHEVQDAAVTRVGRILRSSKLDELPQIWNILRRELSLVGPRPCLPIQSELIEARGSRGVYECRPGITGLAQVKQIDMRKPQELAEWDARYRSSQSIVTDLLIIWLTIAGRGAGDPMLR